MKDIEREAVAALTHGKLTEDLSRRAAAELMTRRCVRCDRCTIQRCRACRALVCLDCFAEHKAEHRKELT